MSKLFIVLAIVTVVFIQCCDSGRTHKRKQEKPAKSWTGHLVDYLTVSSLVDYLTVKEENKQNKVRKTYFSYYL
ncbi:hypothetical protein Mgra_00007927 [Meloidogyne graminicola]|uniref:Uncharacterized protein n=1 Tax=Meloidogyne graminicola TaxID=189291 RepID=A0A8S9ZHL2_9BILA|nr:hypothetical protein Mgra_00007927 [Meloidogyne graminicola]